MIDQKKRLEKYYTQDRRLNIDPTHRCIKSQYGTFCVGDKVRYTDEIIDMANSVVGSIQSKKFSEAYKSIWQQRFMVIVGFDADDEEIVLIGYHDKLTQKLDTHICHLSNLQLVTETELLLYEDNQ